MVSTRPSRPFATVRRDYYDQNGSLNAMASLPTLEESRFPRGRERIGGKLEIVKVQQKRLKVVASAEGDQSGIAGQDVRIAKACADGGSERGHAFVEVKRAPKFAGDFEPFGDVFAREPATKADRFDRIAGVA